ncbi:hypothetical protein [Actinoplanes sp. NPDC051494]|uniref:hypothetical protein n=1 Tax=Actinoplanes sp. NPDC051494 TaxID=3363907 RepID=UPI0037ABF86E
MNRWSAPTLIAATLVTLLAAPAPAAVAADTDTPLVPAEAGPAGSDLPLVSGQTGSSGSDVSAAAISVCTGGIDYPHISGTSGVTYTISVHFDGSCRTTPTQHNISGSLYRHRWYGWEHLRSGSVTKPTARKLRLPLNKGCDGGALFRYRGSGRFYALVGKTSWSRSFYNENAKEIKCVRTPGASS